MEFDILGNWATGLKFAFILWFCMFERHCNGHAHLNSDAREGGSLLCLLSRARHWAAHLNSDEREGERLLGGECTS